MLEAAVEVEEHCQTREVDPLIAIAKNPSEGRREAVACIAIGTYIPRSSGIVVVPPYHTVVTLEYNSRHIFLGCCLTFSHMSKKNHLNWFPFSREAARRLLLPPKLPQGMYHKEATLFTLVCLSSQEGNERG